MTTTETSIVSKITAEIETAAAAERSTLIGDLYAFLGATEKRITLEEKGLLPQVEAAAKAMFGAVAKDAEKLVGEVEKKV